MSEVEVSTLCSDEKDDAVCRSEEVNSKEKSEQHEHNHSDTSEEKKSNEEEAVKKTNEGITQLPPAVESTDDVKKNDGDAPVDQPKENEDTGKPKEENPTDGKTSEEDGKETKTIYTVTDPSQTVEEQPLVGFLLVRSVKNKTWKKRFLKVVGYDLVFYKGIPPDYLIENDRVPLSGVKLSESEDPSDNKSLVFVLTTSHGGVYPLQTADKDEKQLWLNGLQQAVYRAEHKQDEQSAPTSKTNPLIERCDDKNEAFLKAVQFLDDAGKYGKPESPQGAVGADEGLVWVSPILSDKPIVQTKQNKRSMSSAVRNATITKVITVGDHTEYVITMKFHGEVWTVQRRYRAFRDLHAALQREFSPQILMRHTLPPKKTFGNKEQDFVEERRMLLQHYIRELFNDQLISQSSVFRDFIEFDGHVDHVVMRRIHPTLFPQ